MEFGTEFRYIGVQEGGMGSLQKVRLDVSVEQYIWVVDR